MPYSLEDGKGSRNRANVFENRVKALATSVSLMNHISNEGLEEEPSTPLVGVYESRTFSSVAGSGASLLYLVNNDPDNFVIVDRIFTNAIISAATLPDASTVIQVLMGRTFTAGTGTKVFVNNANEAIANIQPNITLLNGATTTGGVELSRRYINIARVYYQEPITQKSDGIILGMGNSIEIFLATTASTTVDVNMRFAVASPDDMEFR